MTKPRSIPPLQQKCPVAITIPTDGGSDIAVRILETTRLQGVLETLSGARLEQMNNTEITQVLTQDPANIETVDVTKTPTFFVDGRVFGESLMEMVRKQV